MELKLKGYELKEYVVFVGDDEPIVIEAISLQAAMGNVLSLNNISVEERGKV